MVWGRQLRTGKRLSDRQHCQRWIVRNFFPCRKGRLRISAYETDWKSDMRIFTEPFCICGLSLGALLALDYAIRHNEQVAALVLIGVQYKVPSLLIDFQNLIFRCMPNKTFDDMGMSKNDVIRLAHSMRSLDFRSGLKDIKCPVTILCGEKDRANLKASRQLAELLSQSKLRIVPGGGT